MSRKVTDGRVCLCMTDQFRPPVCPAIAHVKYLHQEVIPHGTEQGVADLACAYFHTFFTKVWFS